MARRRAYPSFLLLGLLAAVGCADPRANFSDFTRRIPSATPSTFPDAGAFEELPDVSGRFLVAVRTPIAVRPTESIADVKLTRTATGGTLEVTLTPLAAHDRQPAGTPSTRGGISVDRFGRFDVRLDAVKFPGSANPITGQDFTLTGTIQSLIRTPDYYCGFVSAKITEPAVVDLAGSTFGAIRIAEGAELPMPVSECLDPEELPGG
jgi:hypothetical protein